MPRYGPTLFDYLQSQVAREQQLLDQEKAKQQETMTQDRAFWADYLGREADRSLKLKELEARTSGALGRPAPHRDEFDSRLEEAVTPHYQAGEVERQKFLAPLELRGRIAAQNNETKRYGLDLVDEDRDLERQRKTVADNLRNAVQTGNLEEIKRWHDISERLGWARIAAMRDRNNISRDRVVDDRIERDVQKLGKDTDELAGMKTDLETLLFAVQDEDVAGVGVLAGRVPDLLMSDEGGEVRRASQRTLNALLRAQSGLTVSDQEAIRTQVATKLSHTADDRLFAEGVRELAVYAQKAMRNREARYRPEVNERYRERGGVTSDQMPTQDEDAIEAELDADLGFEG